ncbi:hypothetical protein [Helicobacter sp. UBA3407]
MLLTSLGILGTFIGISIGLATFNPSDIDSSIANLLAGMKTAFYTSLAGMASSILYQSIKKTKFIHKSTPSAAATTQENILPLLAQQVNALQEIITLNKTQESALVAQIKLLETDISTKLNNNANFTSCLRNKRFNLKNPRGNTKHSTDYGIPNRDFRDSKGTTNLAAKASRKSAKRFRGFRRNKRQGDTIPALYFRKS